ncbi:cysteine--tRNA ligase [Francisellaceae bacterium]|nr:cysteine--tRNA ligase [Francisellaceae bacterium]
MQLQIYNSLTRRKEIFTPIKDKTISMYTCGVTVYDNCHIGHARTYISFDMVVRFLRHIGHDLTLVRNITDIDDKIIKRANENNESTDQLVERFIEKMYQDFDALNILRPDFEPKATETIPEMLNFIEALIDKGFAYPVKSGDVYFRVQKFKSYGELSNQKLSSLISGARVESSEQKEDPLDFTLWKAAKPDEPSWDSPWSKGRPGWHIECSAMAKKILGETFDIHAGGSDLKFPHHENEIAQSEACNDKKFANYWMHSGMVQVNAEKMSKSLNNFFTISEVLKDYHPEVIRYFLSSGHYRSEVNYSRDNLELAKSALIKLYTSLRGVDIGTASFGEDSEEKKTFLAAMSDDFNVPKALAVLFDVAKKINITKVNDMPLARKYAGLLKELSGILGMLPSDPDVFLKSVNATTLNDEIDNEEIDRLVDARFKARQNKEWAKADEIRNKLAAMGVIIEDGKQGSTWRME